MIPSANLAIASHLEGAPRSVAAAFAAACAKRLLNNLSATAQTAHAVLAQCAYVQIERYLHDGKPVEHDLKDRLLGSIPDEHDDCGSPLYAGLVDDTLSALLFTLETVDGTDAGPVENASARAIDAAFRFAADPAPDGLMTTEQLDQVWHSPIVQRELERQKRDLKAVTASSNRIDLIARLIGQAQAEMVLG